MGRDGYHIFQGSRGGNDTRLHCLGTVEISGFVFVFVFRYTLVTFDSRLSFYSLSLFWLVHRFMGMGDMRMLIASLPRGAVAGWGDLDAQRNHGMRSCFLFEIDILGVSRGTCDRPYCVGNGLPFLSMSYIDSTLVLFTLSYLHSLPLLLFVSSIEFPLNGRPRRLMFVLKIVALLSLFNNISPLCILITQCLCYHGCEICFDPDCVPAYNFRMLSVVRAGCIRYILG